jgi:hypothetical protein
MTNNGGVENVRCDLSSGDDSNSLEQAMFSLAMGNSIDLNPAHHLNLLL